MGVRKERIWDRLVEDWSTCRQCELHGRIRNKVFGRGCLNARMVFIGYGPGMSEDALGLPFIGPSGKFLDIAISDAAKHLHVENVCALFLNLLRCRPCDAVNGPNRDPLPFEVDACWEALIRSLNVVHPTIAFVMGNTAQTEFAQRYVPSDLEIPMATVLGILHPANLLRKGGVNSKSYPEYVRSIIRGMKVVY